MKKLIMIIMLAIVFNALINSAVLSIISGASYGNWVLRMLAILAAVGLISEVSSIIQHVKNKN